MMKYDLCQLYRLLPVIFCPIVLSCTTHPGDRQQTAKIEISVTKQKMDYPIDSIKFQTGACEGTCPVYSLTLFANNTARFEGGPFCDKTGIYKALLKDGSFGNIASYINQNSMDTLKDEYDDGAVDLPSTMLYIYYRNKPMKMITDMQMNGTPELLKLYDQMQTIVDTTNWVK